MEQKVLEDRGYFMLLTSPPRSEASLFHLILRATGESRTQSTFRGHKLNSTSLDSTSSVHHRVLS